MPNRSEQSIPHTGSFQRKLLFLLLLAGVLWLYGVSGQTAQLADNVHIVRLPIDENIPLIRLFIHPYFYWYIYSFGTFLLFLFGKPFSDQYVRIASAMILAMLLANVVYFLFPTHVPRPEVAGEDLSSQMIRYLYSVDPPYNALPSIHVTLAVLTGLAWDAWLRTFTLMGPVFRVVARGVNGVIVVLICLSTLFVHQHYVADVAAGLLLATGVWSGVTWILKRSARWVRT